jgi:hypothetical protein
MPPSSFTAKTERGRSYFETHVKNVPECKVSQTIIKKYKIWLGVNKLSRQMIVSKCLIILVIHKCINDHIAQNI